MPLGKITRAEMDEVIQRATYDSEVGCWDFPDDYYDYEVYTFIDAIYDECASVRTAEDFDDFMDWAIDNFNDYDVDRVDFLEEYCKWQKERPDCNPAE